MLDCVYCIEFTMDLHLLDMLHENGSSYDCFVKET